MILNVKLIFNAFDGSVTLKKMFHEKLIIFPIFMIRGSSRDELRWNLWIRRSLFGGGTNWRFYCKKTNDHRS